MNVESLALSLVQAPSPSGDEAPALRVAEQALRTLDLRVERQEVGSPDRFNLIAWRGRPRVVLTTHLDTVPGEIAPRIEDGILHGRGACDAKGIAAAMIGAAAVLQERTAEDFALLFVVGEETTSDGAIAADRLVAGGALGALPEAAIFGEPTGLRWVRSHPGVLMLTLRATGEAAHSSQSGSSAVHALLDVLARVRAERWPESDLGPTLLNIGRIAGGSAFNVVAEAAHADVMFRTGADPAGLLRRVRALAEGASIEVACSAPSVRFRVPPAEESLAVGFATDAPFLPSLGEPHLMGPGDILHAHAADERVRLADLVIARDTYAAWAMTRLAERR